MSKHFFICLTLALAGLTVFAGCKTHPPAVAGGNNPKPTCVLVHGAWGGGWDWKHVDALLTADGYQVYRPTLTGQGEHSNLASTNMDLDTHIQDIVNVILWEDLHDVVLVGHSYGGMVITGVADRVPGRIRRLVYVDALLPDQRRKCERYHLAQIKKTGQRRLCYLPLGCRKPTAAARCPDAGQNLQRTHRFDQSSRGRKSARDLHSHRGQRQPAGAGRFLSVLSSRP